MSRAPLIRAQVLALVIVGSSVSATDPHMDPALLPDGCPACHVGHGVSGSPMLRVPQVELCLSCHGTEGSRGSAVRQGRVSVRAEPRTLSTVLTQPHVHPVTELAYSRHEPDVVTCTSCHSPHRGMTRTTERPHGAQPTEDGRLQAMTSSGPTQATGSLGTPRAVVVKRSPRDPTRTEFESCSECHGGLEPSQARPFEPSQLASSRSRSFHPLEAPAALPSPSLRGELSGRQINCTDCHGNSDPDGSAGPHGSPVRYILRAPYETGDGHGESGATYGLCYACHDREAILQSELFPQHALHIVDEQTSCATCHDPHGSRRSRALIRFDDDRATPGVLASSETGRLEFESVAPGAGACYLTCHGYDHAPELYGGTTPEERRLDDKRSLTGRGVRSRRPPRGSRTPPRDR